MQDNGFDPATATPREVDTRLAALYNERARANQAHKAAAHGVHRALGETQERVKRADGRTEYQWPTDDDEAVWLLETRVNGGDVEARELPLLIEALGKWDAANADLEWIANEMAPLNTEFSRRPWSRFFRVTSSAGGHVHSSMECSTCYLSTEYGWLPEWSGQSEDEALAALHKQADVMCSVCYPSAPAEYRVRVQPTAEEARAEGKCLNKVPSWRDGVRPWSRPWADCGVCGQRGVSVTNAGNLRSHEHAEWRIETDREARLDPESPLIGTPNVGDELRVTCNGRTETVKTVRTAQSEYVSHMAYAAWARRDAALRPDEGPGAQRSAEEHEAAARVLAEALAAKKRATVEAYVASMAKKVEKKARTG